MLESKTGCCMGKIVYFGQIGKLKNDKIAEYEYLHKNCWPNIRQLIKDCNVRNYSIFRYDNMVFTYFEYTGEDYEADMARMAADEENKRWWSVTDPCFERFVFGDAEFCADMKHIFYND